MRGRASGEPRLGRGARYRTTSGGRLRAAPRLPDDARTTPGRRPRLPDDVRRVRVAAGLARPGWAVATGLRRDRGVGSHPRLDVRVGSPRRARGVATRPRCRVPGRHEVGDAGVDVEPRRVARLGQLDVVAAALLLRDDVPTGRLERLDEVTEESAACAGSSATSRPVRSSEPLRRHPVAPSWRTADPSGVRCRGRAGPASHRRGDRWLRRGRSVVEVRRPVVRRAVAVVGATGRSGDRPSVADVGRRPIPPAGKPLPLR